MPIDPNILTQIEKLSKANNNENLLNYVKTQLLNKKLTPKDLYKEAMNSSKLPFVNRDIFNKTGVFLSQQDDDELSMWAINFYHVAAQRGSTKGNINYAKRLIKGEKPIDNAPVEVSQYVYDALPFAQNEQQTREFQFILVQALIKDGKRKDAIDELIKHSATLDKEADEIEINKTLLLFDQILDQIDIESTSNISKKILIGQLKPITNFTRFIDFDQNRREQRACFITAKCYEALERYIDAWQYYCLVSNENLPFYNQAIKARKNLLKIIAPSRLTKQNESAPQKIVAKQWKKETWWFDSVHSGNNNSNSNSIEHQLSNLDIDSSDKDETNQLSQSNRERVRRHHAEERFFNPRRSNKPKIISTLFTQTIENRYHDKKDPIPEPIDLTKKTGRSAITAERVFQESIIDLSNRMFPNLGIQKIGERRYTYNGYSGINYYGPIENYKTGDTIIQCEHRTDPKSQRLGDSFVEGPGNYKEIFEFLSKLTNNEKQKEQQLATHMIQFARNHQPITLNELKIIYAKCQQTDVDRFNQTCMLLTFKEQTQWHSATSEQYQLGMMVSQARCLIMIENGFMSFEQAFKKNAILGVYAKTSIYRQPYNVEAACEQIDKLYMVYLQNKNSFDYAQFLKKYKSYTTKPTCALTREQAHQDLRYVYGGENNTDNEAYLSDLSFSL